MHLLGGGDLLAAESRKAIVTGTDGTPALLCSTQGGGPENLVGGAILCGLDWGIHSDLAGVLSAAVAVPDGIRRIWGCSFDSTISVISKEEPQIAIMPTVTHNGLIGSARKTQGEDKNIHQRISFIECEKVTEKP